MTARYQIAMMDTSPPPGNGLVPGGVSVDTIIKSVGAAGGQYYIPNSLMPEETYYALPPNILMQLSGTIGAINVQQFVPFVLAQSVTIDRLAFAVVAAGGAGSVTRAGIYYGNTVTLKPTTLVVDGGEQVTQTTGLKAATVSTQLFAGILYFFSTLTGVSQCTGHIVGNTGSNLGVSPVGGFRFNAFPPTNNWRFGWTSAQAYGALPADRSAAAMTSAAQGPIGYMRVLSVP